MTFTTTARHLGISAIRTMVLVGGSRGPCRACPYRRLVPRVLSQHVCWGSSLEGRRGIVPSYTAVTKTRAMSYVLACWRVFGFGLRGSAQPRDQGYSCRCWRYVRISHLWVGRTIYNEMLYSEEGWKWFGSPGVDSPVPFLTSVCVKLLTMMQISTPETPPPPPSPNMDP